MKTKAERIYDELLVFRCQKGDSGALTVLIERWQPRLISHATIVSGDRDAGKDIVQESWIAIIKSIVKLQDPTTFPAWAYRIVNNKSIDYFRNHKTQQVMVEPVEDDNENSAGLEENEELAFQEILAAISEQHRSLMAFHYLQGLELKEIASILQIPEGTVKSRLFAARNEFKKSLEKYYE